MKALQQNALFSALSPGAFDGRGIKRKSPYRLRRCSTGTYNVNILGKNGVSSIARNCSAVDCAKLFPSPISTCRKRVSPVVKCHSSSHGDSSLYNADERLTQNNGHASSSITDGISDIKCLSSSDGDSSPYGVDERLAQNNGHASGSIRDGILFAKGSTSGLQSGSVGKELTVLAIPAVLGQAIDPLAQLMETAYIGRLGPVELASSGVAVSIFNIISKLFNIPLLSITTSFVAEDISKHSSRESILDKASLEETVGDNETSTKIEEKLELPSVSTALLLSAGIGIMEALALFFGAGAYLNMMGLSPASPMRSPSQKFLALRALGAPAVVVSLAVQGVFRGFKDTKTPLYCVGLGNLLAVFLFPLLMYSFNFGITGAAIATVASQYMTMVLLIWSLSKRAVILPPKVEELQFGGYIKSGGFVLGRTLSVLMTMTLGTSMAARQGPVAMAAHQICLQVWLAFSLLSDALAVSAQALIASSFARCEYRRVKEITYHVLKTGLVIGVALAAVLSVSFVYLAKLFTKDVEVLQIIRTGVLFVSASQPVNALAFVFDGLHYGVSDFSYLACSMIVVGVLSSVFLLYAPSVFGLGGVWIGLTLFMGLRMAAGYLRLYWKSGPWWFLRRDALISESLAMESEMSGSVLPVEADKMELDYAVTAK